jgi:hypothetical protein
MNSSAVKRPSLSLSAKFLWENSTLENMNIKSICTRFDAEEYLINQFVEE